jgi:hypothetical protein
VTVIPIAQYLVHFGKSVGLGAEARRDDIAPLPSFDPRAEEELARSLEEARTIAREEGRAEAAAEFDLALARERGEIEARIASEREAWLAEEGRRMSGAIDTAFGELETRIADSVARILEPFLEAALRQKVVAKLAETLSALIADGVPLLKVNGPQSLLDALKEKLGTGRGAIEYVPAEGADIRATADQTLVETRLKAWIDRFQQALEG